MLTDSLPWWLVISKKSAKMDSRWLLFPISQQFHRCRCIFRSYLIWNKYVVLIFIYENHFGISFPFRLPVFHFSCMVKFWTSRRQSFWSRRKWHRHQASSWYSYWGSSFKLFNFDYMIFKGNTFEQDSIRLAKLYSQNLEDFFKDMVSHSHNNLTTNHLTKFSVLSIATKTI